MGVWLSRPPFIRVCFTKVSRVQLAFLLFPSRYAPDLRDHLESLGFDLSIIVMRWFIPLFSNNMPFSLVFRIWDYLFIVGISGLFRVTMALLLQYKKIILQSDLVQISSFIHDVGLSHLQKEKEVQAFFKTMISLHDVGEESRNDLQIDRVSYVQLYSEFSDRCRVTFAIRCSV